MKFVAGCVFGLLLVCVLPSNLAVLGAALLFCLAMLAVSLVVNR